MDKTPVLIDYCHDCGEELHFVIRTVKPFLAVATCCNPNCRPFPREAVDGDFKGNYNNVPWMARRAGIIE